MNNDPVTIDDRETTRLTKVPSILYLIFKNYQKYGSTPPFYKNEVEYRLGNVFKDKDCRYMYFTYEQLELRQMLFGTSDSHIWEKRTRFNPCPDCNGTSQYPNNPPCETCNNTGKVPSTLIDYAIEIKLASVRCSACGNITEHWIPVHSLAKLVLAAIREFQKHPGNIH